jgi:WD40 repeat protein
VLIGGFSLVVNVHHTDKNSQKIRFINCSFDKSGQVLALADNEGNVFVVDFNVNKFWNLPKVTGSCAIIKFSPFRDNEILAGAHRGPVHVVDVQTGFVSGTLTGHECPVRTISFANDFLCLTASIGEAILWDLQSNTKVQVLNLDHHCTLKHVLLCNSFLRKSERNLSGVFRPGHQQYLGVF